MIMNVNYVNKLLKLSTALLVLMINV